MIDVQNTGADDSLQRQTEDGKAFKEISNNLIAEI